MRAMPAKFVAATAMVLVIAAPGAVQAEGEGPNDAKCTLQVPAHLSPGLSMTPSSGTDRSNGETGTIDCTGRLGGHKVTGPGTLGFEAVYSGSTCLSHGGRGRYFGTVPTEGGTHRFEGTMIYLKAGPLGVAGDQPGAKMVGAGTVTPVAGNCAQTPMTEAKVNMSLSIVGNGESPVRTCQLDMGVVGLGCRSRG
jgi:hypothetical protein